MLVIGGRYDGNLRIKQGNLTASHGLCSRWVRERVLESHCRMDCMEEALSSCIFCAILVSCARNICNRFQTAR